MLLARRHDLTYPNDLGILNQARRQTEKIIDSLHKNRKNKLDKKPITYKKKARKDYLKVAKKRRPSRKERTDAIAKQLQYIKRNLSHIENLIGKFGQAKRRYSLNCIMTAREARLSESISNRGVGKTF